MMSRAVLIVFCVCTQTTACWRRGHTAVRRTAVRVADESRRPKSPKRPVTNFDVMNSTATGLQAKQIFALHYEPYQEKKPQRVKGGHLCARRACDDP